MILVWTLALMAALAALVAPLARLLGRNVGYALSVGFLVAGGLAVTTLPEVTRGDTVVVSRPWIPALDVAATLRMDGLGLVFVLVVLGVGALIMAYCPRYLSADHPHTRTYTLLTLFATAMLGLVVAGDLLLLFFFWELTTVCSFFLIGSAGARAALPAKRALLVTAAGGLALMAAVVLLIATLGTSDLTEVLASGEELRASPVAWAVGALLIVAAFTKSAQLPFHFWLPDAMVAITPVSAYLHAATMVKAGIYLLMRFTPLFATAPAWRFTLIGVGLATAVVGALLALRQHDLKALLAYSTVSQLGLLVAAIGVGTQVALAAAVLHTVAHALFKATLFMLVGIIDREAGSRDIRQLSGLNRVMPVTAVLTALAAMSLAGLPPLLGIVSKEFLFEAFLDAGPVPGVGLLAGVVGVGAAVLTFSYGARIVYGAFAGPPQEDLYEPAGLFLAPAAVAALAGLALGPGVALLSPLVERAAEDARPGGVAPYLAFWHGLTPALWMSVATVAVGVAIFLNRDPVDRRLQRMPTPPPGGQLYDRAYAGLVRFGGLVGRVARRDAPAGYLMRPVVALVLLGAVAMVVTGPLPVHPLPTARREDWLLLVLLVAAVAGLAAVRSMLGAVALLGLVGLVVAGWFLVTGAPDVALTLVLVEVLTAVVAMLVLRRLPARLRPVRPRRAALTAVLAGAAGLVAAAGVATFTGRRDLSGPGAYFLRNAEPETGGTNVVNTILVDFRGLDTLGEAAVLGAAALGLIALLGSGSPVGRRQPAPSRIRRRSAAVEPDGTDLVLHLAYRVLAPVMLLVSAYLFLRGHDEPGGGFIAALVAGIAVGLGHLADQGGTRPSLLSRLRPMPLLVGGAVCSVGTGLAATALGRPFLTPLHADLAVPLLGEVKLTSVLLFDLGIYLWVLALVVVAVTRLGDGAERVPTAVAREGRR